MRKIILLPILLAILSYIAALLNYPLTFIISFASFCYIILGICLGICTFYAWQFCCKLAKIRKGKRLLAFILASICLLLFIFGRMAINRYYMPGPQGFSIFRVSFKVMLLIATGALFWVFVKSDKKTMSVICGILYILFIALAPFAASLSDPAGTSADAPERSLTETLRTLPYVAWAPVESTEEVGITIHDPNLSFKGLNLYTTMDPQTYLMDMKGNILHKWHLDSQDHISVYAEMFGNGDLLVVVIDQMFAKLDWDSNILWKTEFRAHHDFHIAENGDIYALARKDSIVFIKRLPVPILEDYIVVLSPKGNLIRTIDIFDSVKGRYSLKKIAEIYRAILKPRALIQMVSREIAGQFFFETDSLFDIMHNNTIELLDRDIPGLGSAGDILLSVREMNLIGVLDPDKGHLVWNWGPDQISKQHRPTVLANDNILLFDNGRNSGFSRILEVEPSSKRIVWSYNSDGSKNFFTSIAGACQRLPNGNTLITETNGGRVFEITTDGKIVWQYLNPNVNKDTDRRETNLRETLYYMGRITDPHRFPDMR